MILKKGSISDFARRVKETGKQIVIYGAGVIGQAIAPYWLREYRLADAVAGYVDKDSCKQGKTILCGDRQVSVFPLEALKENEENCMILVAVSAFEPVVHTLEQELRLSDTEVYFLPIMLLDMAHAPKNGCVIQTGGAPLIPKKIHYCWFSGKPIPQELRQCIDSWRRFCPDYEIIRWDEKNYDVSKNQYMEQAYAHRKWGYIPDYARLDILYQYGGIYLDTDVELLGSLDALLYQPAFCSTEKWGIVNMGISGAQPGNLVIRRMLDNRQGMSFLHPDGTENLISSGVSDTLPLVSLGLLPNGETQSIAQGEMTVYAPEFFQPFDYISGETHITDHTFSIHHFSGTWLGAQAMDARKRTQEGYRKFLESLND